MEASEIFELPYPEETDAPDGPAQIKALVDRVEELLAVIEGLVTGAPAPGNLIVVNGTSDPVYRAITGDVAFNSTGVTTVGAGKILEAMLGGESVATAKIKALAVTAAKIAEGAIETAKLANLSVTEGKLAALAVTAAKLAAEAVETGKIKNLAVTTAKIALLAITEGLIADGAVTSRKFKPTAGTKSLTAPAALNEAFTELAGLELKVTPAVASLLLVTVSGAYMYNWGAGVAVPTYRLTVDGAGYGETSMTVPEGITSLMGGVYAIELSAAAHTIKVQMKRNAGASVTAQGFSYLYQLIAS